MVSRFFFQGIVAGRAQVLQEMFTLPCRILSELLIMEFVQKSIQIQTKLSCPYGSSSCLNAKSKM
jgi:hypothetical protein